MTRTLATLVCFGALVVAGGTSHASGALDVSFATTSLVPGAGGVVTTLGAIRLQPDGKVVAGGADGNFLTPALDFLLVRAMPAGGFDPSFGTGGIVRTSLGAYDEIGSIVLRADGSILAAGGSGPNNGSTTAVLLRYEDDGTPDATFGTAGIVTTGLAGSATSLVEQPDGALVIVAGNVIARFLADGTPDASFGMGGIVDAGHRVNGVLRQPDGALVVAGQSGNDLRLLRVLPDGASDPTFGTGGSVTIPFPGFVAVQDFERQPDGRILVSGQVGSPSTLLLARVLEDGTPDPSFGVGGVLQTIETGFLAALGVDTQQRIIGGGRAGSALFERYSTTGVPDDAFPLGFAEANRAVVGLVMQPDDRFVASKLVYYYAIINGMPTLSAIGAEINRYHGAGACGDGTVDPGELCEPTPGDPCCGASCRFTTAPCASDDNTCTTDRCEGGACTHTPLPNNMTPCNDASLCTDGDRCLDGVCTGFPVSVPPCKQCVPETGAFVAGPRPGCKQTTQPGRSSLTIKDVANAASDKVTWKWTRGEATTIDELGDPVATSPVDAHHDLCVFDESGADPVLVAALVAPAGHTSCAKPPCWKQRGSKLTYKSGPPNFSGVAGMLLGAGTAGKSSMRVTGKGVNLFATNPYAPPPSSPLPLPLRVQLGASDGACWEATFSASGVRSNAGGKFVGTSD